LKRDASWLRRLADVFAMRGPGKTDGETPAPRNACALFRRDGLRFIDRECRENWEYISERSKTISP
jgi:hypothetical protein